MRVRLDIRYLTHTVKDDRGQRVPLCAATAEEIRRAVPGSAPREAIFEANRRAIRRWGVPIVMVLAVIFVLVVRRWLPPLLIVLISLQFLVPLFFWAAELMPIRPVLRHRRRIRDAMLASSLCASCGYRLSPLQARGDDGCTVCPECGSAWQLPQDEVSAPTPGGPEFV